MPLILFNKPYRVLSQFTDKGNRRTLADFIDTKQVYPAGRLDYDSEGLLLLTDDGRLQARIAQPRNKLRKYYWVQVEGCATTAQLQALQEGVALKDGPARAVRARIMDQPPGLWPRDPPIRVRKSVPDCWLEVVLKEGRNRQVRRMTAAVGLPTLRLVRHRVGPWRLGPLAPGEWCTIATRRAWSQIRSGA
jgi:23S rRNA pseudouridine2457 synthase